MCLITFSWQPTAEYPLILTANRDEQYSRPTLPVHYWEENSCILGGKDLKAGGSWLAINKKGRFAAITNFREVPAAKNKLSRGKLVSTFIYGTQTTEQFIKQLNISKNDYPGFSLLLGDHQGIHFYSNRSSHILNLKPGIYALSNHLLNTPWQKVEKARNRLSLLIKEQCQNPDSTALLSMMSDCTQAPDWKLPDTGADLDFERLASSCFIKSPTYGTRNTSIIKIHSTGFLKWTEQIFGPEGERGQRLEYTAQYRPGWSTSPRSERERQTTI